jgi:hypothetical protein
LNRKKKPIKILKKPAGSVWFYKPKTEKKPSQTGKNETNQKNRAKPVSVRFFKKKFSLVSFFDKNRTGPKIIIPSRI